MEKRRLFWVGLVLLAMAMAAVSAHAEEIAIEIDVAPNVLNLNSNSEVVTVHTDIAYGSVAASSVMLNDVAIDWWKADARGNFVAKFNSEDIKTLEGLVIGGFNTLVLLGYTTGGDTFIGMQEILVVDNTPTGKN